MKMAAPEGNQFWKLRSKHGREKLFSSPEMLWEAACEYFEWCENNPLYEVDYRGKEITEVNLPKMRAFTIQGLTRYIGCNVHYLSEFEDSIKDNKEIDQGFSAVITRVREIIYQQKFEGAAAGLLNSNIIARDLGLSDKSETKASIKNEHNFDYSKLSEDALNEIASQSKFKAE